jgi:hypothetical protein
MSVISKEFLSGSTNGKQIKIAATATPGTLIHAAHATAKDEIWLFADNDSATTDYDLTIEYGGVTDIDNTIKIKVPKRGTAGQDMPLCVLPGFVLSGGLNVRAFCNVANKVKLSGYVNRDV